MSPFCMDTGTTSRTPLVDRVIDDALLQTVPHYTTVSRSRALWASGCSVLLKSEVTRNCTDIGQHLLFQQHTPYVPIIHSIYFDARVHKYNVGKTASFVSKNNCICIYCARKITQESRAVAGNPRDAAVIFDP